MSSNRSRIILGNEIPSMFMAEDADLKSLAKGYSQAGQLN